MSKIHALRTFSSLAALSLSLSINTAIAEEAAERPTEGERWLEEVTVIGEKKVRSLKETTSSVSVISQEELDSMRYFTVSDAVSDVANVVSLSGAVPDIRGVKGNGGAGGFNSISGGAKARVSTLIDGVAEPFVADLTGDSGIWDVEQIEVYRGPQSTTNGRNSIGGSIYIKTADPTFDWEGAARVGYRNQENYVDTSVMLSGPIMDETLAFRVTAQRLDAETLTDPAGFASNPPSYPLNEIDTTRFKGKLLWQVSDDTRVLLTHSRNNEQGDTGRIYYTATNPWAYKRTFLRDIETDSNTTSIKLDTRISDSMSFDILVAYMNYEWGFDSYEPNPAREQQLSFDQNSLSVDAKLNFGNNNDHISGFIGLTYFDREQNILSEGAFPYFGKDENDSKAIYGEVDFAITEQFSVTLGGRFEKESQLRDFTYLPIIAQLDVDETIFLPKVALQYDISNSNVLSFSARQGYNAAGGALNFFAQEYYYYDKETVDSYELSWRVSTDDGRANLTTNIFYNDYDGYQALNSARAITNMDTAVTYGAELEALFRPTADLELRAGLGLLETEIKDGGAEYSSVTGNELNSAPGVTANLSAKYWFSDEFNVGASYKYVAEYFGDLENTSGRVAGDYGIARFSADYRYENWSIAAFLNNAFDEKAFTVVEPIGRRNPEGYVAIVQPRNVGVSVTYNFN